MTDQKLNKSNWEDKVNWLAKNARFIRFDFGRNNLNSMKRLLLESLLVSN